MSNPFYYNDNTESSHRVCREINPWHTFNIPPPSPKRRSSIENEEIPVLTLESFQRPPLLNFGKVTVSSIVTKSFNIYNPVDDKQEVRIFKLPKPEFGFVIDGYRDIIVEGGQTKTVDIRWKPDKPGNVRVKVHFTTSYNEKFELTIIGMAQEPAKTVTKRRAKPRRNRKPTGKVESINPNMKEELPLVATDIIDKDKLMKNEAAIVIQKNFRRCIARKEFLRQRTAALIIQRYWLRYYTKKLNNRRATFIKGKRPLITSVCLENEMKKMEAAIVIQKYFRGFITRKNFLKQVFAAKTIQRHWRQHYIQKLMENESRKHASAIIIQKHFRSFIARRDFMKKVEASLTIQRYWRQHYIQTLLHCQIRKVAAAIVIQKHCRRFIARKNFLRQLIAAKTIQRCWRRHVMRNNARKLASAIVIQKNIRCLIARRDYLKKVVASKTIQRCWRHHFIRKLMEDGSRKQASAIIIQKNYRRYIARKNFLKKKTAAKTIQRWWRRHVNRRKCPQKTSIPEKDISLNVANLSVAECLKVSDTSALPIGCRTDLAFKKLIHYRKFCQLQTALSSLDTTTKISPESCIKISSPTAVDTIINIIKQSNRSEPSKFVIADAFSILLTLVKYDKTQDLIINRPSIIYLCIEKAKIYIRVPHITNRCLTLLYLIIVKSPDRESIINNSFIIKNLTSLINTETTTIKSHKKHKITKELVFYPYWSSAKDVMYEFTDRFTALEHINYLFKGKLF